MNCLSIRFEAEVWVGHSAKGEWFFITLPEEDCERVQHLVSHKKSGKSLVRVSAHIANTEWQTSLFLDKKLGGYILPIKSAIRKSLKIIPGQTLDIYLTTML